MNAATGVLYAVGFNGYRQLNNSGRIINRFTEIGHKRIENLLLSSLWSRTLFGKNNLLTILSGSEISRDIEFEDQIKAIAANEEVALILLANHTLWKVCLGEGAPASQLSVFNIERGLHGKREDQEQELPILITSTLRGFYAITNRNSVFSLPTKIGYLPEGAFVTKLVSGFEHCLALLDSGDVFVWGGGLKGQLGIGELEDVEEPTLLEALSGIRIIEVAAGGWHSCAISEFGDLYVWGWNRQGQLGIPVKNKRSIYLLPEIVDVIADRLPDPEEIELISCGSSHSIILTKSGKLLGTGSCNFGQLSEITSPSGYVDQFQALPCPDSKITRIICGPMTSFIFASVPNV